MAKDESKKPDTKLALVPPAPGGMMGRRVCEKGHQQQVDDEYCRTCWLEERNEARFPKTPPGNDAA